MKRLDMAYTVIFAEISLESLDLYPFSLNDLNHFRGSRLVRVVMHGDIASQFRQREACCFANASSTACDESNMPFKIRRHQ